MKKRNSKRTISNQHWTIRRAVCFAFSVSPVFSIIHILACIINGIFPAVNVSVNALFVNTAVSVVSGKKNVEEILIPLTGILLLLLWQNLSDVLLRYGEESRERKMTAILQNAFLEKTTKIKYQILEMPETQDLIKRAATAPEKNVKLLLDSFFGIGILALQNVSVLLIVVLHVWWAGILMIAGAVPLIYISLKAGEEGYQVQEDVVSEKRRYEYLSRVMLEKQAVLEKTLFSFTPFINKKYEEIFSNVFKKEKNVLQKWIIRMKTGGCISAAFAVFTVFLLLPGVKTGALSAGLYISVINAVFSLVSTITWNLSNQMENLAKSKAVANDLSRFCSLPEDVLTGTVSTISDDKTFKSLEFVNVRFCYPGSDRYILDGLTFTLTAGKHYAFVGKNGAGKTTVIKLLAGLYQEYEGKILVNGKNLKAVTREQRCRLLVSVWQDYAKYSLSIRENLCFDEEIEENKLRNTLSAVGLWDVVEKMPKGVDSILGKLTEDSVDLSEGQWQRLAIARAIIRERKIIVLDEPTASLDPMAENQVYRQFMDASNGRTAIFITHRLGAIKDVNEILVLENGKVAEKGTHKELMGKEGLYAQMYLSQQEWYS